MFAITVRSATCLHVYILTHSCIRFVDVHYQLIPYFLTTGSRALESNTSAILPLAKHDSFIEKV